MTYQLDLRIDEVVFEDVEGVDRGALGAAIEHELARLIRERGVPAAWMSGQDTPRVNGGSFSQALGASTDQLASQIARAVYTGASP